MNRLRRLLRSDTGRAMVPAFAVSLVARFAQLAMSVLAARLLQPTGFGVFTFALGIGLLGGRVGSLGWPVLVQRALPGYRNAQHWPRMRGLLRAADGVVAVAGIVIAVLLAGLALLLGPQNDLYGGLLLGAVLLPFMAFRALYRNALAALRIPQKGIMVDELIPAVIMTLALGLLWGTALTPDMAVLLYIGASAAAVLAGFVWLRRALPAGARSARPAYAFRSWMAIALPALVGMSAKLLMNKTDVLMLAPLGTLADVGLYGAALRLTYVMTAPVIVLSTVITSRIAEAFSAGRNRAGRRLFFGALIFATGLSLPLALALVVFAKPVMTLAFGADYAPGASVLAVLALAQVGAAINIPVTSMMLMTGWERAFGRMTVATLVLNIAGNALLIPAMGAKGAAIATCLSIWVLVGLQAIACRSILRAHRAAEGEAA